MTRALVFPDGVRLARRDELPGPESWRAENWAKVQSATISPGFVIKASDDQRFSHYAEVNVDAPDIWAVFWDLSKALLDPIATVIGSEVDADPVPVGSGRVPLLVSILEPHKYQLAHDGFLQFGLMCDDSETVTEVLVAPTKHFRIWLNNEETFRAIMENHEIQEDAHLQFIDEYPRTTVALPEGSVTFRDASELISHLADQIRALSSTH